jgi:hypothetical protein
MCKTSIFEIFFPCLYNFALLKYRTDRIRIHRKFSGSDRIWIRSPGFRWTFPSKGHENKGTAIHIPINHRKLYSWTIVAYHIRLI